MKPNFNADQTGDLKVWVPTSAEVNGVFRMGAQTIFTGSVEECCRRALCVTPDIGMSPEVWCDSDDILKGEDFAKVLALV